MANVSFIFAQSEIDAVRYSTSNDLLGTARYMSMGGAFGALGGDISCMSGNPAGLAVFSKSEVAFSPNINIAGVSSNRNTSDRIDENKPNFFFNNIGIVGTFNYAKRDPEVKFRNLNIGANFSRVKSFYRNVSTVGGYSPYSLSDGIVANSEGIPEYLMSGDNAFNSSAPWLPTLAFQSYLMDPVADVDGDGNMDSYKNNLSDGTVDHSRYESWERGYIDSYDFSIAGNFDNLIRFGVGLGINSLRYETEINYDEFYVGNKSMNLSNYLKTTGYGVNLKFGLLLTPIDNLRLGLSLHTPTFYDLSDEFDAKMVAYGDTVVSSQTPIDRIADYRLQTPLKFSVSAAYIIKSKALISAEYQFENTSGIKLKNDKGQTSVFEYDNNMIKDHYKATHTIRVGAEVRPIESLGIRLGFATVSSSVKNDVESSGKTIIVAGTVPHYSFEKRTYYYTAGLGYNGSIVHVDLAYVLRMNQENLYAYPTYIDNGDALVPSKLTNLTHNIVATIGFKF